MRRSVQWVQSVAMIELSRREFLQGLAAAYGAAVMGCRRTSDRFAQELVCIHIFPPAESISAPLLKRTTRLSVRDAAEDYFDIGLPELLICTTRTTFLDMFQYFWPLSRDDFARMQQSIEIRYYRPIICGAPDIDDFAMYLRDHKSELARGSGSSAVIFTFNEFTRYWTSEVIAASRDAGVKEFVLFKDPSQPPYLCTYPATERGSRGHLRKGAVQVE
jgi:hypothetical protein